MYHQISEFIDTDLSFFTSLGIGHFARQLFPVPGGHLVAPNNSLPRDRPGYPGKLRIGPPVTTWATNLHSCSAEWKAHHLETPRHALDL